MFAARIFGRFSPAALRSLTTVSVRTSVGRPVVQSRCTVPKAICLRATRTYQTEAQAGWRSWEAARKPVGLTGIFRFGFYE